MLGRTRGDSITAQRCSASRDRWTGITVKPRLGRRLNQTTRNWHLRGSKMAAQEQQAEPSMEEILASIRRIISEEEQAPAEPVLDLTEAAAEPVAAEAAPEPAGGEDDIVFEAMEPAAEAFEELEPPTSEPAPAPVRAAQPVTTTPETIISNPTASAAAGSMARLVGSLRVSDTPGQTVEGVVRELLKPMLKEWLDQNLPTIVEARVEAELERIARLAR